LLSGGEWSTAFGWSNRLTTTIAERWGDLVAETGTQNRSWERWDAYDWAEHLLDHYFGRGAQHDPVRALVTTDAEFAAVACEFSRLSADVVDRFIDVTNASVGKLGYWEKASEKSGGSKPYLALPYLVLGCVAAVGLDHDDERSFLRRFDDVTKGKGSYGIEAMPDAWRRLSDWLESNSTRYRSLHLPDPGGLTRIGHTVRLAFPSKSDQHKLVRSLDRAGLNIDDPPIAPVQRAVRADRKTFSVRFVEEFDKFELECAAGSVRSVVAATPFWQAVQATAHLQNGSAETSIRHKWSIVADDDGYDLSLRLVAEQAMSSQHADLTLEVSTSSDHDWPYESPVEMSTSSLASIAADLGQLGTLLRGGVVPFRRSHAILEVAQKRELIDSGVALVRGDLCADFVRKFGGRRYDHSDDWHLIRDAKLTLSASEDLDGGPFETTWILHRSLIPNTVHAIGGLPVEGGFLALDGCLPTFRASGSEGAIARVRDEVWDLERGGQDLFRLPSQVPASDLIGDLRVAAEFSGSWRERTFRMEAAPAREEFRRLGDMSPWIIEGTDRAEFGWAESLGGSELPLITNSETVQYLGRNVGEFCPGPESAAWRLVSFGSSAHGRQLTVDANPVAQAISKGSCRRWRKQLNAASFLDPAEGAAARAAAGATHLSVLGEGALRSSGVLDGEIETLATRPEVDLVITILAACANRRAGLALSSVLPLLESYLGRRGRDLWHLLRSWTEAGVLTVATTTRFRTRLVFAEQPTLHTFRTETAFGARLTGLVLPSTRARAVEAARSAGASIRMQGSELGLTPETLCLRTETIDQLREISRSVGIATEPWPGKHIAGPESDGTIVRPVQHEPKKNCISFCDAAGVAIRQWTHERSTVRWEAVGPSGSQWYFHRENAEFASAAMNHAPIITRDGAVLESVTAKLPLPIARRLNTVARVQSGTSSDGAYRYHCPTFEFAQQIEAEIDCLSALVRARAVEGVERVV
jgi:hypothetical protein